uniref:Methylosome subunit pICln n=1 Tax=Hirondellea gigas TaxID=1518452 RepID=A0A2P2HZF7_9CRUS
MLLTGLPPPDEGIHHTEINTSCFVNQRDFGKGVLYVAQSRLCWFKTDSDTSFSFDYPHIAVHAVCRDLSRFPRPHLFVMIDMELFPEDREESDDEDENLDPEDKCTAVRFAPDEPDHLDDIYRAISNCQILHPDPEQLSDNEPPEDEEEYGDYDTQEPPPGPLPRVQYEQQQHYEEDMLNGLGDNVISNGHGPADEDEAMDHDQFEDC